MHSILKAMTVSAAALLFSVPCHADGIAEINSGTLSVGRTGINCVMAPCPWRGIRAVNSNGLDLLWSSDRLPAIKATADDAQRITQAWHDLECLLVEGEFDGTTLIVDRILGACP